MDGLVCAASVKYGTGTVLVSLRAEKYRSMVPYGSTLEYRPSDNNTPSAQWINRHLPFFNFQWIYVNFRML